MENIIKNLKKMTMDEIAQAVDINNVDRNFYHLVRYYHPEIAHRTGALFSYVCDYRKWLVKENNAETSRSKKLYGNKKYESMISFYEIILSLAIDANEY